MNHSDPEFIKLIDIIQATPMARINREDARHIAEYLVTSGVVKKDFSKSSAELLTEAAEALNQQGIRFFGDSKCMSGSSVKPVSDEDFELTPKQGIPWDIDNNRPYEEWEIMLIDGRGVEWDTFRNSYPTSLQQAILAQGKGHPNHPEHEHTDCCK